MSRGRYPRHIKVQPPDRETARKYLLRWNSKQLFLGAEAFPELSSQGLFGDQAPFELDVGCGIGGFLCRLADQNPAVRYAGMDIALKPLYKAVATAAELALDNIRFIKADIRLTYPLLAPESIRTVYLHFPNPNLRPAYRKRRIFSPDFLNQMHKALVPEGKVSLKTDEISLFKDMLAIAQRDERFLLLNSEQDSVTRSIAVVSHHQRLWEGRGREIHSLILQKKPVNERASTFARQLQR